jgi:preprotein translocase subunit SecA
MGVLYRFLGLTCEALLTNGNEAHDDIEKRRICAEVDVVYVTGQNLAFNWLFDQRVLASDNEVSANL